MKMLSIGLTISSLLTLALLSIGWLAAFRSSSPSQRQKKSPYECGIDPHSSARAPICMPFFLLAVIFLIFDVEVVVLLPLLTNPSNFQHPSNILAISLFILILLIGLYVEYSNGSLDWQ